MAKAIKEVKIERSSLLSFERKLANSDAVMAAGNWESRDKIEGWSSIQLKEKAVRGTISNLKAAEASDPMKLDAKIESPNLQRVDVAALPFNTDTLRVTFTLRILGDLITPSACNRPDYQNLLASKLNSYIEKYAFTELANRYAENIANGRFLWRNRVGAEEIEVRVTHEQETWVFDSHNYNLRQFAAPSGDLVKLADVFRQGLSGSNYAFITVNAFVRLGAGQEVYPSQELVMSEDKDSKKDKKSKILYHLNDVAAMHSQKIGNALRTIDTWFPEAGEIGPIAVEPYGSVTNRGIAYRRPKIDFYSILDAWVEKDQTPLVEQQHYVVATLIRGGVFSNTDKTDKKEKE